MKVDTKQLIRIVVPKGRMETTLVKSLNEKGYHFTKKTKRSLFYTSPRSGLALLPLKSRDIITFLDSGYADMGIVGRDVYDETIKDLDILRTLPIGQCRMSIAARKDYPISEQTFIKIATKYPQQAKEALGLLGIPGQVITLESSVELAPLLSMADCILDIVETGNTLKENDLEELITVKNIQALAIKKPILNPRIELVLNQFLDTLLGETINEAI